MVTVNKTPRELIDDIYSLALWMTGSRMASTELVRRTFLHTDTESTETELLKTFRQFYIEEYGQAAELDTEEVKECSGGCLDSLKQWASDIRLSVLLSEISGLRHVEISDIVGKPVETIRMWLLWGRKLMTGNALMKISA